jgi:opacity protein-like surface antigen
VRRWIASSSFVLMVCSVLAAAPARAQGSVTPFIGAVFGGDVPSSRVTYGGSLLANRGPFGFEIEVGHTPTLFEVGDRSAKLTTVTGNILIGLPLGRFHPYGVAGLGLMRQTESFGASSLLNDISASDFGHAVGGGAWLMVSPHVGVRADMRFFQVRQTDGFDFGRAYGGLMFAF